MSRRWSWLAVALTVGMILTGCAADEEPDEAAPDEEPDEGEPDEAEPDEGEPDEAEPDEGEPDEPTGEPINFGYISSLSGPFAPWGVSVLNGMQMAIDDVNAQGGVLGRPMALIERDDGNVPEEGVTALTGMVERDEIVAAGGVISSDVGLATSRAAEEEQVPLFLTKAGSGAILTPDSRYTFRTCLPAAPMGTEVITQYVQDQGFSRVGAIIADYAWGRANEEALDNQVAPLDGVDLHKEIAPVGEDDFTTYIRGLIDFDPDLIVGTGHPPGMGPFTQQAADLGLDVPILSAWVPLNLQFQGSGEAVYDRVVDFKCADAESPEFQELASRYYERFEMFMEDDAVSGYGQIMMVAEAIEATGSSDPVDVADYLREGSFELPGYAWDLEWTEWGEMANAQPVLVIFREMDPPEGVNPGAPWWGEFVFQADPLEPYVPQ